MSPEVRFAGVMGRGALVLGVGRSQSGMCYMYMPILYAGIGSSMRIHVMSYIHLMLAHIFICHRLGSSFVLQQCPYPLLVCVSSPRRTPIVCTRADVGRLPFATGSVDAIHAGAAIHCWPNPQAAMAEISRVLKPGGVFVASTFLNPWAPLGELVGDQTVRPLSQVKKGGHQGQVSCSWRGMGFLTVTRGQGCIV